MAVVDIMNIPLLNHDNADIGDLIMKIMVMMVMPKTTSQTTLSAAVVGPRSTSAR